MTERIKKEVIKLKTIFTNKPAEERWIYILQAYSLYLAFIIFIFSMLEGLVAAYALLLFAVGIFIVISFYTSYNFKEIAGGKMSELSLAVYGLAIFIPMAFVVSGATFRLAAFFASVFIAAAAAGRVESINVSKIKKYAYKLYGFAKTAIEAAKTKAKRRREGVPYALHEVGSASENVQE